MRAGRYEQARRGLRLARPPRAPADETPRDPARRAKAEIALGRYERGAPTARGGGGGPPRRPAACATRSCASTSRRRSRRAGAADRRQLRRLERAARSPAPAAADLLAIATAVRLDGNWKDANDVLRDAVRADPRATARQPRLGRRCCSRSTTPRDAEACVPRRAQGRSRQPRRPRRAGARRRRRPLRRRGRARRDRAARWPSTRRTPGRSRCGPSWRSTPRTGRPPRPTSRPSDAPTRATPGAARVAAAAALLLDDRGGLRTRARAPTSRCDPNDGAFFAFVAEALTRHRRYDDARAVAERRASPPIPTTPAAWRRWRRRCCASATRPRGLDALRRAWKRDPYDVRTYNLLNLLREGDPRPLHDGRQRAPALPGSDRRPRAPSTEVVAPVPRGALPRLRRPLWRSSRTGR